MEKHRQRLWEATKVLLGDQETRKNGEAEFERWPEARRVRPQDRAYPLGCMVQQPNMVEAPAAAFRLPEEEPEHTHHDELNAFVNVGN